MTDETLDPRFERVLRAVLAEGEPADAPTSLYDAVAAVSSHGVARSRTTGRIALVSVGLAAVFLVATVAILGALRLPGPTPAASQPLPGPVGLHLEYEVLPVGRVLPSMADVQRIQDQLGERMRATGLAEFRIGLSTEGDRITVDIPALPDAPVVVDEIRALLGATGRLDFVPLGDTPMSQGDSIDLTAHPSLFSNEAIAGAELGSDQTGSRTIDFTLSPDGASAFATYSAANVGSYFAIALDGVVISAPIINEPIADGRLRVYGGEVGGFTLEAAQQLVALVGSGPLPFTVEEVSVVTR